MSGSDSEGKDSTLKCSSEAQHTTKKQKVLETLPSIHELYKSTQKSITPLTRELPTPPTPFMPNSVNYVQMPYYPIHVTPCFHPYGPLYQGMTSSHHPCPPHPETFQPSSFGDGIVKPAFSVKHPVAALKKSEESVKPLFPSESTAVRRNDLPQNSEVSISQQPAVYQIANYNMYPAPILNSSVPPEENTAVQATLIELSSGCELSDGFQGGNVRTFRAGTSSLQFNGLKLSNMGTIKSELRQKSIVKGDKFAIRFKVGTRHYDTQSFKLVSSCTQLPKEIREAVRPSKRASISVSPSEDTSKKGSPIIRRHSSSSFSDNSPRNSSVVSSDSHPSSPHGDVSSEKEDTKPPRNQSSITFLLS